MRVNRSFGHMRSNRNSRAPCDDPTHLTANLAFNQPVAVLHAGTASRSLCPRREEPDQATRRPGKPNNAIVEVTEPKRSTRCNAVAKVGDQLYLCGTLIPMGAQSACSDLLALRIHHRSTNLSSFFASTAFSASCPSLCFRAATLRLYS